MGIAILTAIYLTALIFDKLTFNIWHLIVIVLLDIFFHCGGSLIKINLGDNYAKSNKR